MSELLLARHGETEWSVNGRHTGGTDLPLTETGRRRARGLANLLSGQSFALVLTSPLRRAVETCELAGLSNEGQMRDDLREWDYGAYEGLTTPEILERRGDWSLWRDGCPEGEQAADVGVRADRVIAEARAASGSVIAFGHGHMLRVLGARWVGLPPEDGGLLKLDTEALCTLGYEHAVPVVVRWNQTTDGLVGGAGAARPPAG
jgi:probable phosphoglycerate mutase